MRAVRHKNPEGKWATAYGDCMSLATSAERSTALNKLAEKYAEERGNAVKERVIVAISKSTSQKTEMGYERLSFLDLCNNNKLNPFQDDRDVEFGKIVALGRFKKKLLTKKEIAKLVEACTDGVTVPESAKYSYLKPFAVTAAGEHSTRSNSHGQTSAFEELAEFRQFYMC